MTKIERLIAALEELSVENNLKEIGMGSPYLEVFKLSYALEIAKSHERLLDTLKQVRPMLSGHEKKSILTGIDVEIQAAEAVEGFEKRSSVGDPV
jgi:hypothetical protein